MTSTLRDDAQAMREDLVSLRRQLHQNPEPGFALPQTQAAVLAALDGLGLEITAGPEDFTSVTAVLHGARPGPSVLLRADMDALKVPEETGLSYASRVPGVMHACGHDLHTAGLVGAAKLLAQRRDQIAGSVVFMFEPGEEAGGGAARMIDEGVLDAGGDRVEAAYGIHIMPGPAGVFSTRPGALMAGANTFRARIVGRGGHGSRPAQALDPVPVAAEIVLALQAHAARKFDTFDPVVISVTQVQAGHIVNAIPDDVRLGVSVRTLSDSNRIRLQQELPELVTRIAAAHGCTAECDFSVVYPVTANDPARAGHALTVLEQVFGAERAQRREFPMMWSEDFSLVLNEVPGAFLFLAATPEGEDPDGEVNHSSRVLFDDGVLPDQAAALAALALSHVSVER